MKIYTLVIFVVMGILSAPVDGNIIVNNPDGLDTPINSNAKSMEESVGNVGIAGFNALPERYAITFEVDDGYTAGQRFDRVELLEADSGIDLRVNFDAGVAAYRQIGDWNPTGGDYALILAGAGTLGLNFIDPLTSTDLPIQSVAFTANRIQGGDLTIRLWEDTARTTRVGDDFLLAANDTGSGHSFFGYIGESANISAIDIDGSGIAQFSVDDLNIALIPEPAVVPQFLLGAGLFFFSHYFRRAR